MAATDVDFRPDNFPQIAGFYSQLAGLLAGFAFASLIALIAAQLAGNAANYSLRSYRPLISAFLGLVATSLNYAIISGGKAATPRMATLETVAGLGFCVAGTMLLYSILVLLKGVERDLSNLGTMSGRSADLLRYTLVLGVCPLLIVLLYGAIRDHLLSKYGPSGFHWLDIAALIALLFSLSFSVSVLRWRETIASANNTGHFVDLISRLAVAIAVLSLLFSALINNFMGQDSTPPDSLLLATLIVLLVFTSGVAYSAATYRIQVEEGV